MSAALRPGRNDGPRPRSFAALGMAGAVALLLAACAAPPDRASVDRARDAVPATWNAPLPALPHGGSRAELARWWDAFDDPQVARLVAAADAASPTIASAASRIETARAARAAAGAALLPALDGGVQASRGRSDLSLPAGTQLGASLSAAWEIDVFGRNRAGRTAADARLAGSQAEWHDARVAVAAETATTYVQLRSCEARLAQARLDSESRGETARLTGLATDAGFESKANAALARASAAQARTLAAQQAQACSELLKGLVALTGIAEPALRIDLSLATARVPEPPGLAVESVPATALAQRPDVVAAAREVEASSADIARAEAARLPRVTLAGSVGRARYESSAFTLEGNTWSIGPLSVSVPLFDAGARRAEALATRARYDAAVSAYAGTLRGAVREVENALVALQTAIEREADARTAAVDFEYAVRAVDSSYRAGLGSLFDLEEARRNALTAQNVLIDLRRDRSAAWIALYRSLGGAWTAPGERALLSGAVPAPPTP